MGGGHGNSPVMGTGRNVVVSPGLVITANVGGSVALTDDPDNLLDATTPVSYAGVGQYTLNFKDDWSYIGGTVNVDGVIGDYASIVDPVYTKGANAATVVLVDLSGGAVNDITIAIPADLVLRR